MIFPSTDILPDPPDGTPLIESITGKTITLSWKKPRRLDPSIGMQVHGAFVASFRRQTAFVDIINLSDGTFRQK